jgi:hypothetical protein
MFVDFSKQSLLFCDLSKHQNEIHVKTALHLSLFHEPFCRSHIPFTLSLNQDNAVEEAVSFIMTM